MKELLEALEKAQQDLESSSRLLASVTKDGDAEKIKAAKSSYEEQVKIVAAAQKALDEACDEAERVKGLKASQDRAKKLLDTQVPEGADLTGKGAGEGDQGDAPDDQDDPTGRAGKTPKAKLVGKSLSQPHVGVLPDAKDREAFVRDQENLFYGKWLAGAKMSDRERDFMMPVNRKLLNQAYDAGAEDICLVPISAWCKWWGAKLEIKSLPTGSGDNLAAGGGSFLHWPEFHAQMQALPHDDPSFFNRVRKVPMFDSTAYWPKLDQETNSFGGVVVTRNQEGQDADETEAKFRQFTLKSFPLAAYTELTNRMLRLDQTNVESQLSELFGDALRLRLNTEILHGTGPANEQCMGIRQSDDVNFVSRILDGDVGYDDFVNLESALRVAVRQGASYAITDTVVQALKKKKLGDGDARPLFQQSVAGGVYDRVNDRPWFNGIDMSLIGGAGDVIFGNWMNYWLGIEMEAVLSRSQHYKFRQGRTAYRLDSAIGGDMIHPGSFAVLVGESGS